MQAVRPLVTLVLGLLVSLSCADGESASTLETATVAASTTAPPTTRDTAGPTSEATTIEVVASTTEAAITTTTNVGSTTTGATTTTATKAVQPVVWPTTDVVFATPEAAAADFIGAVFGVEPLLGDFAQGDTSSGEIEVLSPGDDDDPNTALPTGTTLLLRQLGSDRGWFVIAAVNDDVTIASPDPMARVPAGPLTIEGLATGHERTVLARSFVAGVAEPVLDDDFTMAGLTTPEPYAVTLDLSGAAPGATVALVVQGDTGLDNATGRFASIPIVIS